jgi:hypothetical protein
MVLESPLPCLLPSLVQHRHRHQRPPPLSPPRPLRPLPRLDLLLPRLVARTLRLSRPSRPTGISSSASAAKSSRSTTRSTAPFIELRRSKACRTGSLRAFGRESTPSTSRRFLDRVRRRVSSLFFPCFRRGGLLTNVLSLLLTHQPRRARLSHRQRSPRRRRLFPTRSRQTRLRPRSFDFSEYSTHSIPTQARSPNLRRFPNRLSSTTNSPPSSVDSSRSR